MCESARWNCTKSLSSLTTHQAEHRLRQKGKCELSPYFQDRLDAENSDYVLNLSVTVNVMHGGWFLYQVSIFKYLEPGQWHAFFSFSSFLPAFTFLLQLFSFWLQLPWYGCTSYGDFVYFKRLRASRYCFWKLSRNHPLFIISVFSKCLTIFDRATWNQTSKIMGTVTVQSTVTAFISHSCCPYELDAGKEGKTCIYNRRNKEQLIDSYSLPYNYKRKGWTLLRDTLFVNTVLNVFGND